MFIIGWLKGLQRYGIFQDFFLKIMPLETKKAPRNEPGGFQGKL